MHVLGFVSQKSLLAAKPLERQAASNGSETAGVSTVHGPSQEKNGRVVRRPVFEHGNYDRYYGYRHADGACGDQDPRLLRIEHALGPDFFATKEVLDVGCNAGLVSLAVGQSFKARRVVGIDIDTALIDAAEGNKRKLAIPCDQTLFEFRAEDILESPLRRPPTMKAERFDIILCFSVTKWVHFAHGDAGIRNLFRRFLKRLKPGGILALEPQDWKSYKKKRFLTSEIRETVRGIELRPEHFGKLLHSLGFRRCVKLEPPQDAPACFRRTLYLYEKPVSEQEGAADLVEPQLAEAASKKKPTKKTQPEELAGAVIDSIMQPEVVDQEDNPSKKRRKSVKHA
jgi:7SK snRNA methylphosphate capping enzyme